MHLKITEIMEEGKATDQEKGRRDKTAFLSVPSFFQPCYSVRRLKIRDFQRPAIDERVTS